MSRYVNLWTVPSGQVVIAGNLNSLTVTGIFQGQGTSAIDLSVGLNLDQLTVLGGSSNLGGVRSANIAVGKDIVGLNIQHGIFNSLITAGVLIDRTPRTASSGGNIGPDGSDAIFDSQLLAGVQIKNLLINGDVKSDYVTNPKPDATGYPTRIVAGEVLEDRAPGGTRRGASRRGPSPRPGTSTTSRSPAPDRLGRRRERRTIRRQRHAPDFASATVSNFYNAPTPPPPTPGGPGFNTYDAPKGFIIGGTVGVVRGTPTPTPTPTPSCRSASRTSPRSHTTTRPRSTRSPL